MSLLAGACSCSRRSGAERALGRDVPRVRTGRSYSQGSKFTHDRAHEVQIGSMESKECLNAFVRGKGVVGSSIPERRFSARLRSSRAGGQAGVEVEDARAWRPKESGASKLAMVDPSSEANRDADRDRPA